MGRDSSSSRPSCSSNVFQSTRPVWGATEIYVMVFQALKISIHAPRVGRDHQPCCQRHGVSWHFNPRAPCGARPGRRALSWHRQGISIHAPRVGRDICPLCRSFRRLNFNPRAPCGARPFFAVLAGAGIIFQSTRPVWGATISRLCGRARSPLFQSTRPVWGATANLTILPRQICTKGTKEFLLGRKTHGKKEK